MDYREKIVHGDVGLPVAVYEITPEHLRYRMNIHWHPEHEILHVRSGSFRIRVNDVTYSLVSGDVLFIPGGAIHSGEPENCCYTCILTNLSELLKKNDACAPYAERLSDGSARVASLLNRADPRFSSLCEEMLAVHRAKSEGYPFELKGLVHLFFGRIFSGNHFFRQAAEAQSSKSSFGRMKSAIIYIREHYDSPLRLETLAALVDLSPNHFCRSFREITGQTPFTYLQQYRLQKAQYALKTTEMTVTEIAMHCGFHDASYFIRSFRETYGMTPKQFRRSTDTDQESTRI
ncbi:MAG: helix-turn-helix domain-containing protein [Ruminococcaceae bacterium]|nr:helix-turn-helix domain-containing protein [Oscillospiraceae bacterium]